MLHRHRPQPPVLLDGAPTAAAAAAGRAILLVAILLTTLATVLPGGSGTSCTAAEAFQSKVVVGRGDLHRRHNPQWAAPQPPPLENAVRTAATTRMLHHSLSTNKNSIIIKDNDSETVVKKISPFHDGAFWQRKLQTSALSVALGVSVLSSTCGWTALLPFGGGGGAGTGTVAHAAADPGAIVGCLVKKCPLPLARCALTSPKCLANIVCINTCNDRPDEIECQVRCGDQWDNPQTAAFNKCAVSDMSCVPQQADEGLYPKPSPDATVRAFDTTKFFNGRLYITAGQNPLFDIFPCQVHFFTSVQGATENGPAQFYGKLNWRVTEPGGNFFSRDALQEFYQDPADPSHMINDDNEYLHYKDDWYIIDYEYDKNNKGVPAFAFVYYRGSNDAWDGYGGVVVYTRAKALPEVLLPRLRAAAKKVNFDFDRDFVRTDNSCPSEPSDGVKVLLREQFAGKVVLQTEQQLRAAATRLRGNAVNPAKNRGEASDTAIKTLNQILSDFEEEANTVVSDVKEEVEAVVSDVKEEVGAVVSDVKEEVKAVVSDVKEEVKAVVVPSTK